MEVDLENVDWNVLTAATDISCLVSLKRQRQLISDMVEKMAK